MKLMWFHLAPYTDLPASFPEENESVWVTIDRTLFDRQLAHRLYNDFLDEMEVAAEVGFDAVCVNEHHANGYGLMPSPNLMAAAMTRRIRRDAAICVMGTSIALYNPPLRVAEEYAMLDLITGGRIIAGFPVGSAMDTCYAYSQNPASLRQRFREAHDLIIRSWTDDAVFDWNGRFYKLRDVNVWQRPLQRPHPPIWIPGGTSEETWRWAAAHDYVYSFLSYFGYKLAQHSMENFWRSVDELGKDRNPFRTSFLQFVGVAESRREAIELYREAAEYFYNTCLHVAPRFATAPGYIEETSQRSRLRSQVVMAAGKEAREKTSSAASGKRLTMEQIVDRGYVIVGSPDEVADQLRELALSLNVGHLMMLCQFGNMNKETTNYNTRLFAARVAPQLRGLFDDQWEDRWWPSGLGDTRIKAKAV
jgi:alkanesulfonate monooxygenase SsuD/methylene tetrahydromethanopterin reductase-like flavin-dependent oxidoreductase (luciferase family)